MKFIKSDKVTIPLLIALSILCGYLISQISPPVNTVYASVEVPVYKTEIKYVDVPIIEYLDKIVTQEIEAPVYVDHEVVKEVIKPVITKIIPNEFPDLETAQEWIATNQLPITLICNSYGNININNYIATDKYDCDDYSTDFENLALSNGWKITQCLVTDQYLMGKRITTISGPHAACMTKINGVYYYIETTPLTSNSYKLVEICRADK